jgi:hypothetical protein
MAVERGAMKRLAIAAIALSACAIEARTEPASAKSKRVCVVDSAAAFVLKCMELDRSVGAVNRCARIADDLFCRDAQP